MSVDVQRRSLGLRRVQFVLDHWGKAGDASIYRAVHMSACREMKRWRVASDPGTANNVDAVGSHRKYGRRFQICRRMADRSAASRQQTHTPRHLRCGETMPQ